MTVKALPAVEMTAREFNELMRKMGRAVLEQESSLALVYERAVRSAAAFFARQFEQNVIVASSDWNPPASGIAFDTEAALAAARAQREAAGAALEATLLDRVKDLAISFDPDDFRVFSPDLLDSLGQQAAKNFDLKMRDSLASAVRESFDKGLSVPDTAKEIQSRIRGVSRTTATMLARTDLIGLANGGSFMAAQQVFPKGERDKVWLNAHDARVRPSHSTAGGQVVPLNQPFQVGLSSLMYPGDPMGAPGEVINCRCTFTVQESKRQDEKLTNEPSFDTSLFGVEKGEEARRLLGNFADTEARFKDPTSGGWSEARKAIHRPIVAEPMNGVKSVPADQRPVSLFLAGGSGAGKGTIKAALPKQKYGIADIDADAIKDRLPEYRTMVNGFDQYAAIGVHEESSWLAKQAVIAANERRMNVLIDGTGDGEPGAFLKKIRAQQDLGNRVEVVLVDLATETAVKRVRARAVSSGRHIADDVVRDLHEKVARSFHDWRDEVDDWEMWGTEGPRGSSKLFARKVNGVEEILDQARFEQFLDKDPVYRYMPKVGGETDGRKRSTVRPTESGG